jgi:hypothetical protein
VQQLESFRNQRDREQAHACDIAGGPPDTRDKAGLNRVRTADEDDWNNGRGGLGRLGGGQEGCRDHRRAEPKEIGRQCRQPLVMPVGPAEFEPYVASIFVSSVLQAAQKCAHDLAVGTGGALMEESDQWRARLLRPRAERACRSARESHD